jgi:D-aspartate ligase
LQCQWVILGYLGDTAPSMVGADLFGRQRTDAMFPKLLHGNELRGSAMPVHLSRGRGPGPTSLTAAGRASPEVRLDREIPVLMIKLAHSPLHHGVLGAIRSLGRAGVPVYGVHEDRLAPAGLSRYLTGRFIWPPVSEDPEELLEGLLTMADRIGRQAILLPTDDWAAVFIGEHDAALRRAFWFPAQSDTSPRQLADKLALSRICRDAGIASPAVTIPASLTDVVEFAQRTRFPVMLKLSEGSIRRQGLAMLAAGTPPTSLARTSTELLDLYRRVEQHKAGPVLLQEYLPAGEDWIVHGYCNQASEYLVGFTGMKLRSYPPGSGGTTFGVCRSNPALLQQAQELCRKVGYRGIMDMDWRLDPRDGRYHLLDFNPRLGAQFRLFVDDHGVDVVRAMHLDLTGRAVPRGVPPEGRAFMAEQFEVLAVLAGRRRRELTLRQWWSSARSPAALELGWLDRADLVPAAMLAVRSLARLAAKASGFDGHGRATIGAAPQYLPGRHRPARP